MVSRVLCLAILVCAAPALAQENVRVPVEQAGRTVQLTAQLFRPSDLAGAHPAVAIFHGCGGVGANNTRMAELLKSWGYVALVVDSFTSRGLKEVCTQTYAERNVRPRDRVGDAYAALAYLRALPER